MVGLQCLIVIFLDHTHLHFFNGINKLNFKKHFTERSKAVHLLWIINAFCPIVFVMPFVRVCLFVPCGHLLGRC